MLISYTLTEPPTKAVVLRCYASLHGLSLSWMLFENLSRSPADVASPEVSQHKLTLHRHDTAVSRCSRSAPRRSGSWGSMVPGMVPVFESKLRRQKSASIPSTYAPSAARYKSQHTIILMTGDCYGESHPCADSSTLTLPSTWPVIALGQGKGGVCTKSLVFVLCLAILSGADLGLYGCSTR